MMKHEHSFSPDDELIIVTGVVTGPRRSVAGRFVLDTGAAATTIVPNLAELIGYGPRDGIQRTTVHSAIGKEDGYTLRLAELRALGFAMPSFGVNVFDLGFDDIDGLLGLNFLSDFNYEVRSAERRILIEKIAH